MSSLSSVTLISTSSLATALCNQGKFAEPSTSAALIGAERVLGVGYHDTLMWLHPADPIRLVPELIYDVANSPLEPLVPSESGDVYTNFFCRRLFPLLYLYVLVLLGGGERSGEV